MEHLDKEVYFHGYCQNCKYWDRKEDIAPCDDCLAMSFREWTHKPAYFEEKEGKK